jgi:hypothetical protein
MCNLDVQIIYTGTRPRKRCTTRAHVKDVMYSSTVGTCADEAAMLQLPYGPVTGWDPNSLTPTVISNNTRPLTAVAPLGAPTAYSRTALWARGSAPSAAPRVGDVVFGSTTPLPIGAPFGSTSPVTNAAPSVGVGGSGTAADSPNALLPAGLEAYKGAAGHAATAPAGPGAPVLAPFRGLAPDGGYPVG